MNPHEAVDRVVLFTDMVSYSSHIGEDEAATLEFMSGCFDTLRILARRYNGTLVKTLGDGAMLLFDDPQKAIEYGVEFQRIIAKIQLNDPNPFTFRVGLHQGGVILQNGDAYGNTVNVAARLQTVAEPGRCVVSQNVYELAKQNTDLEFEALGAPDLKNISERVPVYRVNDPLALESAQIRPALPLVRLLNGIRIDHASHTLSEKLGDDAKLVLGYLTLCSGRADSLDRIAALLGKGQQALNRAKASLRKLQKSVLKLPLDVGDGMAALDPMKMETDLEILLQQVRQGRVPEQLTEDAEWPQRILSGLFGTSPVFLSWLGVTRDTWKRRMTQELERLLGRTSPDEEAHEDAANAVLLLEPGNEVAAQARIDARLQRGDQSGAFEEFDRLERYLGQTHGISPGERIRRTIRLVKEKGVSSILTGRPTVTPVRRLLRIAVAEFTDPGLSGQDRLTAFRGDLIANLARFRDWSIIDGVGETPAKGGVDYRIDGTMASPQATPILGLRLSDEDDGRTLWAESFPLSSEAWDSVQRDIIGKIAATIESYISADRLSAALATVDRDPTSHDAWLRGDRAMMRWTPEGADEARDIFEGILKDDPDHTPSLTSLASLSNIRHVIWPGLQPRSGEAAVADRLASRAVELDPMDSRIQRVVAWSAAMTGEFARATMHMDLAANLNPNSPVTMASCAMGFAWFGERDKAEASLTRLRALGRNLPSWVWAYVASTCFFLGRLDDALEAAELGGDSISDTQGWLAVIHAQRGETQQSAAAFARYFKTVNVSWSGEQKATAGAVADWFATAFPLRNDADRERVYKAIHAAREAAQSLSDNG
ncbi:adenylate/guanylate cyclase domain-containing protein [Hoeflea sp.]|uniref:adenylate/guanylate cyclase domain-containing protein n=1 Tax=Hoeflea sp. TaxID=1940281 RepID=UPI003B02BA2B